MKEVHMKISGRVQGVCYRAEAQEKARELEISGWIRNKLDGSVECRAQGDDQSLVQFIAWCRLGPKGAKVQHVQVEHIKNPQTTFEGFEIVF